MATDLITMRPDDPGLLGIEFFFDGEKVTDACEALGPSFPGEEKMGWVRRYDDHGSTYEEWGLIRWEYCLDRLMD